MAYAQVSSGLDAAARNNFGPLRGLRVGLVTNPAAVDANLRHVTALLAEAPEVRLAALFGPEHGLHAEAQDLIGVGDSVHPTLACPVYSLYGATVDSLRPRLETLRGLDALVIDLPDIGSRYYTFQATMLCCLEAAARIDLPVIILDRPNPIGGVAVEGPLIQPGFESFVGAHPIAIRHGMTLGELAQLYAHERGLRVAVHVVACEGWARDQHFDATNLPWVLPSPNMPTPDTALVYPGQCLVEGTNLSEGRGTTRPFEICGAPWLMPERLVAELERENLPGIVFRPVRFRPTFHKFAGQQCGGVQLHVTDRDSFRPVRTSLALLIAMRKQSPKMFAWRTEPYEFVDDKPAIDLLFGGSRERLAVQAGLSATAIAATWAEDEVAFKARRQPFLLYGRS